MRKTIFLCRLTILSNRTTSSSKSANNNVLDVRARVRNIEACCSSSGCDQLHSAIDISSHSTEKTAGDQHFGSGKCKIELVTEKQAVSTLY